MSERKKLFSNSLFMLINRLGQAITSFVLTAAIARGLGAAALGQYVLAISYFYIFVNLASQGFKTLFTREISREPESTPTYLVTGTLLQLIFCLFAYAALVIVIYVLPYSRETSRICYIIGLTVIPFGLSNITEAILQAEEKMHLIAVSTVPLYILRVFLMILAMNYHYSIEYVGAIFVASETLILVIEWLLIIQDVQPQWQLKKDFIWHILKLSRTFFAIEGIGIIASRLDVLIISLLGSELLIGIYGAIGQVMQPFSLVSSSVSLAAFPNISKAVYVSKDKQREVAEGIIETLLCMGLPFFVGLLFIGQEILVFIYKDPVFTQPEIKIIFHILSIAIITSSFSRTFSYLLIANGYEKFNLLEVLITTSVSVLSGIILISHYKLLGAAYMDLAMTFSRFGTLTYAVYSRILWIRLFKVMRIPLIISAFMAAVFLIMKNLNLDLLITILLAMISYAIFVTILAMIIFGGFTAIKQKLLNRGAG